VTQTPTRHHVTTLATIPSRLNPRILVVREVLAHPHAVFYPCTCGLYEGVAAVAVALIGYNDIEVAAGTITRRRRS
jgi:hypothetical protein